MRVVPFFLASESGAGIDVGFIMTLVAWVLVIALIMVSAWLSARRGFKSNDERLDRLDHKIDKILKKMDGGDER